MIGRKQVLTNRLAKKHVIAIIIIASFIIFYLISTLIYTQVFNEQSFLEELLFLGNLQQTIFKALILFEFAIFSIIIYVVATKNLQTEKLLKNTEQRWATTLAGIGDAVIITDNSGKITYMNTEAERITGWKLRDSRQKPAKQIFRIVNSPTGITEYDPVSQVLEKKLPIKVVGYSDLSHKEGLKFTIESSAAPIKDEINSIKEIVLIFHDVTKKRKKELELIESKNFSENILDAISDPIYVIDPNDFRILAANKEASKLMKLGKLEMQGKTCYNLTHHRLTPCEGPLHKCPMSEVLESGKAVSVEHVHADEKWNPLRIEVTLYPIKNNDGEITQIIHMEKDISKRKSF